MFIGYLSYLGHCSRFWGYKSEQSDKKSPHIPGIYILVGERKYISKKMTKLYMFHICYFRTVGQDVLHTMTSIFQVRKLRIRDMD